MGSMGKRGGGVGVQWGFMQPPFQPTFQLAWPLQASYQPIEPSNIVSGVKVVGARKVAMTRAETRRDLAECSFVDTTLGQPKRNLSDTCQQQVLFTRYIGKIRALPLLCTRRRRLRSTQLPN